MAQVVFHVSGFGEFFGVKNNPTEILVKQLKHFLDTCPLKPSTTVESTTVFETSAVSALSSLAELLQEHKVSERASKAKIVFVHLGVHGGASNFRIETAAWNEANFGSPDQRGWSPNCQPIIKKYGDTSQCLKTKLPVDFICSALKSKGYDVETSTDPGRFLCNYIYFQSLHLSSFNATESLFVHVPPFERIPSDVQISFLRDLLGVIAERVENCSKQQDNNNNSTPVDIVNTTN
eukprot:TRINITY_DN590_c0_g1_i1.p1 TRINITY_DN590_c0_g1~~TRINITY_DN590_c0_g1_i1.p1  ORF type:complete len:235 (+),score=32.84 TRINITY_DN590_c0_g1_i1:88-792(+)